MSALEDIQNGLARYYGPISAVVTDNADPAGRHRVRARVPSLGNVETDWAYPLTAGGGAAGRGGHVVPIVGADVVVQFEHGDPNGKAFYQCGWWSAEEMPQAVRDAGADAAKVHVLQVGLVQIVIDERAGQRSVRISDEQDPPTSIEWDLEKRGISIDAVSAVVINAKGGIHMQAPSITFNGRRVAISKDPIG